MSAVQKHASALAAARPAADTPRLSSPPLPRVFEVGSIFSLGSFGSSDAVLIHSSPDAATIPDVFVGVVDTVPV